MHISKDKTMAISIALLLSFSLSASMILLPTANAQTASTVTSYAYLVAAPNPVGVGQTVAVVMDVLPSGLFIVRFLLCVDVQSPSKTLLSLTFFIENACSNLMAGMLLSVCSFFDFFRQQMNKFDRPNIICYIISKHATFMIVRDKVIFQQQN
jgi:hypothetical protein